MSSGGTATAMLQLRMRLSRPTGAAARAHRHTLAELTACAMSGSLSSDLDIKCFQLHTVQLPTCVLDSQCAVQSSRPGVNRVGRMEIGPEILGYGSSGTLVFEGTLDGRPIAVKRILCQVPGLLSCGPHHHMHTGLRTTALFMPQVDGWNACRVGLWCSI